jgi:hypothetical protein
MSNNVCGVIIVVIMAIWPATNINGVMKWHINETMKNENQ